MDRDYLSSPRVVAASKEWVCARLLTYESAEEAKVLTGFFTGRSGLLENTTFVLVAPDGKTALTRGGRSPDQVLRGRGGSDDGALAALLATHAKRHPARAEARDDAPLLPYHADVRRALDAAACDLLPLVVVLAKDAAGRGALEQALRPLAWADARYGKLLYVAATSTSELEPVTGVDADARLLVVQPDAYGLTAKVLAQTSGTSREALAKALDAGLAKHKATVKEVKPHIAAGRRQGVHWETEIPDTDPGGKGPR